MKKIFLLLLLGSVIFTTKNSSNIINPSIFFKTEENLKVSDYPDVPKEENKKDMVEKKEEEKDTLKMSVELVEKNGLTYEKGSKKPYTGIFKFYDESGVKMTYSYKNGVLEETIMYDANGEVFLKGTYKNGKIIKSSY